MFMKEKLYLATGNNSIFLVKTKKIEDTNVSSIQIVDKRHFEWKHSKCLLCFFLVFKDIDASKRYFLRPFLDLAMSSWPSFSDSWQQK